MSKGEIEVEMRAPLEEEDVKRINAYLKASGAELAEERERRNYLYDCLQRECNRDLRVKETNGMTKLSLKLGDWSDVHREEIEWEIGEGQTEKAKWFLAALGHSEGLTAAQQATIWNYKDLEVAVVRWNEGFLNYLEIEGTYAATAEEQEAIRSKMTELFEELGARPFGPGEYEPFMDKMDANQEAFSVPSPLDEME